MPHRAAGDAPTTPAEAVRAECGRRADDACGGGACRMRTRAPLATAYLEPLWPRVFAVRRAARPPRVGVVELHLADEQRFDDAVAARAEAPLLVPLATAARHAAAHARPNRRRRARKHDEHEPLENERKVARARAMERASGQSGRVLEAPSPPMSHEWLKCVRCVRTCVRACVRSCTRACVREWRAPRAPRRATTVTRSC